jgi:PKD repeat protein
MKLFNHLLLAVALLFAANTGLQAQCATSFTWTANGNVLSVTGTSAGMTPGGTYYTWNFGDGSSNSGSGANATHAYNSAGLYLVCVTAYDSNCTTTYCDSVWLNGGAPCAGFGSSFTSTNTGGTTMAFNSTVTGGTPTFNYSWDFGDGGSSGGSSSQANPTYTYSSAGVYAATLVVTDTTGCAYTAYDTVYVNGGGTNPCAGVAGGYQYNVAAGGATTFVGYATGFPSSFQYYTWSVDNVVSGTSNGPTWLTTLTGGWHIVCVDIQDSTCTYSYCDSVYVPGGGNPCAGFSANYTYTTSNNVATFTNMVTGGTAPYTYSWMFGDGGSSALANPVHTYANVTSYYGATLVVIDANGCAYTAYDTVSITTSAPCTQNEVIMLLNFDNYAYETSWDLRNLNGAVVASGSGYTQNQGGTSLTQTFCLPAGCYSFNIYDSYGDGICCLYGQGYYSLTNASGTTIASGGAFGYSESTTMCVGGATSPCTNFGASFTSSTAGSVVNFLGTSTSGNTQYIWDFGDNTTGTGANPVHTYANATASGYYVVCVTAIDSQGCTATFCDSVLVSPAPCAQNMVNLTLNLDNFASETSWTVTDASGAVLYSGGGYSHSQNGSTIYQNFCLPTACYDFNIYDSYGDGICCAWGMGSYALTDASGSVLASGGSFAYAENSNFCIGGASNPCGNFGNGSFTYSVGAGGLVTFTPVLTSNQFPMNFAWNFGNGNVSSALNPSYTFANGYHVVCVTADSGNCTFTYCDTIMVSSNANSNGPCNGMMVNMNITQDTTNPFALYLQPVVTNAPLGSQFSFVWDYGDNTGAFSGSPTHMYNNYGSYVICLMAIDSANGCVGTFCDTITIDSFGNFSRTLDYKDIKPGFFVNTLPAIISYTTAVALLGDNDDIAITLYPNPANDVINLLVNSKEDVDGNVSILDISGKKVYTETVTFNAGEQQVTLPVNNLPAGVYLVKMTSDSAQKTMKFIKE